MDNKLRVRGYLNILKTCTNEILAGLGKMYIADERFKKNIDKYGEGTAEFASESVKIYTCKKLHCSEGRNKYYARKNKTFWCLDQ